MIANGGNRWILEGLCVNPVVGIKEEEIDLRIEKYGANKFK